MVHFGAVVADAPSPLSTPRSATGFRWVDLGLAWGSKYRVTARVEVGWLRAAWLAHGFRIRVGSLSPAKPLSRCSLASASCLWSHSQLARSAPVRRKSLRVTSGGLQHVAPKALVSPLLLWIRCKVVAWAPGHCRNDETWPKWQDSLRRRLESETSKPARPHSCVARWGEGAALRYMYAATYASGRAHLWCARGHPLQKERIPYLLTTSSSVVADHREQDSGLDLVTPGNVILRIILTRP